MPAESGVVTKCELNNAPPQEQKTVEMKVNISGTEFVLLDNLSTRDTNAVVLKVNKAPIKYRSSGTTEHKLHEGGKILDTKKLVA